MLAAWVEGASQDPTPDLLITGHPIATAALAPTPAAARQAAWALSSIYHLDLKLVGSRPRNSKPVIAHTFVQN